MKKLEIRPQRVSDAKRFYDILNNDNFVFFHVRPKNVEEEKKYLRQNKDKAKKNFHYNYTILYDNKVVGGCGIKIDQHRTYIGEIGYFLDEEYWGKGIVTKAVKKLEQIGFKEIGLTRIEIFMHPKNISSKKVAEKCGYKKEGIAQKSIELFDKKVDAYVYAKIK